jgi:hypothetical protein
MIKDCTRCGAEYETSGNQVYCTYLCRFLAKVDAGDCWNWTGPLDRHGYGKFTVQHRSVIAHRWLYAALVGEIPGGLDLDHLCYVKTCVNPDHLQPVTPAVNSDRRRPGNHPRGYAWTATRRRGPRATPLRLRWRLAT